MTSESLLRGTQAPWSVRSEAGSIGLAIDAWPSAVSLWRAAGAFRKLSATSWVLSSDAPSKVSSVVLGLRRVCAHAQ